VATTTNPTTTITTVTSTTGAPTTTVAAGPQPCRSASLAVTLGRTDGAAGNQYTPIVFTNEGAAACTLDGHPGVSFLDASGAQVGDSAVRTDVATPTVTLAPGGQAHATMDYHDPGLYDDCAPRATTTLRVYPPDETVPILIAHPSSLCTRSTAAAGGELSIDVVEPGPTDA
jgi:hypothetical protein